MEYPSEVWRIVRQAVGRCKGAESAAKHAERNLRAHPDFESFVDTLIAGAVRDLVGLVRNQENQALRKGRAPAEPNKVRVGASQSIQKIANWFAYRIGGTTLGNMTLEGITTALAMRKSQIETAAFEWHLLNGLKPLMSKGKRVQDVVSRKQLDQIVKAAERAKIKTKKAV